MREWMDRMYTKSVLHSQSFSGNLFSMLSAIHHATGLKPRLWLETKCGPEVRHCIAHSYVTNFWAGNHLSMFQTHRRLIACTKHILVAHSYPYCEDAYQICQSVVFLIFDCILGRSNLASWRRSCSCSSHQWDVAAFQLHDLPPCMSQMAAMGAYHAVNTAMPMGLLYF